VNQIEVFFFLLLAALCIAIGARRAGFPYSVALLLGGLLLALIPGLPVVELTPEMVFLVLLPPILFVAAYFTSWRDFWRWRRAIILLAFALVTATSAVVAAICVHFIPGMNWATGFVLGAIVSPPDAAAAVSITRGVRLPRRIVQVLEGESLINDAAGLTIYRFALAAVMTGTFSLAEAAATFVWIAAGGIAIGVALAFVAVRLFPRLKDPQVEIVASFLLCYLSYFLAEAIHVSGVLATVAAGLLFGWHSPEILSATTRIRATAVWQTVLFVINVMMFLLIGLQLREVFQGLRGYPMEALIGWSAACAAGVILLRMIWVFPNAYIPRLLSRRIRETEPPPTWQGVFVVGWTGLRGAVSMAAALALPLETSRGLPFPYRNMILFITFSVILVTLLLQGLSLRAVICKLGLPEDHSSEEEEIGARISAIEQALERLAEMERQQSAPSNVFDRVRGYLEDQLGAMRAQQEMETGTEAPDPHAFQSIAEQRLWWEVARVQRETVVEMRRSRRIGDEAMRQIEQDIDLLEARIVPRG
jgi:Na+/H+ antiporter